MNQYLEHCIQHFRPFSSQDYSATLGLKAMQEIPSRLRYTSLSYTSINIKYVVFVYSQLKKSQHLRPQN